MDDLRPAHTTQLEQSYEAQAWTKTSEPLVLKSPHTNTTWPLRPQLVAKPWENTHRRRYPGYISEVLRLEPLDARLLDFHLIASPGFHTFCSFNPRDLAPPPWPSPSSTSLAQEQRAPSQQQQQEQQQSASQTGPWWITGYGASLADNGVKRCEFLLNSKSNSQASDDRGFPDAAARPSYLIVSPFFGVAAADFLTLLMHHMRFHARLGVDRYLVYVEERIGELSADPRVKELTAAGKLRLVAWREFPHYFANGTESTRHYYASQTLVYNHALVALWHEDAVAAIADVDEYLITPQPTTLRQVLEDCGKGQGSRPVASLQVPRRWAYCTGCWSALPEFQSAHGDQSIASLPLGKLDVMMLQRAHPLETALWLNATAASEIMFAAAAAAVTRGTDPLPPLLHPLALYGLSSRDDADKSVVAVSRVAVTNPHTAWTVPLRPAVKAHRRCAYWMHLRTQLAFRLPYWGFSDVRPTSVGGSSLWVLEQLRE